MRHVSVNFIFRKLKVRFFQISRHNYVTNDTAKYLTCKQQFFRLNFIRYKIHSQKKLEFINNKNKILFFYLLIVNFWTKFINSLKFKAFSNLSVNLLYCL